MTKRKRSNVTKTSKHHATKTILFVDDEPGVCDLARDLIPADKYFLEIEHDGDSALEKFKEINPDIVVTDLRMPGIDGLEVIEEILKLSPDTPIIVLSAKGDRDDAISTLKMGVSDYLVKPEKMRDLETAVEDTLKKAEIKKKFYEKYKKQTENLEKTIDLLRNAVISFGKRKKEFDNVYRSLKRSERKYRSLIDNSPIGIVTIDDTYKITEVNRAFYNIMGFKIKDEVKNASILDFNNFIITGIFANIHECFESSTGGTYEHEYFSPNEDYKFIKYTITPIPSGESETLISEILFSVEDITIRKEFEKEQERKAKYCSLTGLLNQNYFMPILENTVKNAEDNNQSLALIYIDVDDFKYVNDNYGHPVGNQLLKSVGKRLRNSIGENDHAIRCGGDEFSLILVNYQSDLRTIVDRIFYKLSDEYLICKNNVNISLDCKFSFGISEFKRQTPEELFGEADTATLFAKSTGKNKFVFFKKGMTIDVKK